MMQKYRIPNTKSIPFYGEKGMPFTIYGDVTGK